MKNKRYPQCIVAQWHHNIVLVEVVFDEWPLRSITLSNGSCCWQSRLIAWIKQTPEIWVKMHYWSLWSGNFDKIIPWKDEIFRECILLLEVAAVTSVCWDWNGNMEYIDVLHQVTAVCYVHIGKCAFKEILVLTGGSLLYITGYSDWQWWSATIKKKCFFSFQPMVIY